MKKLRLHYDPELIVQARKYGVRLPSVLETDCSRELRQVAEKCPRENSHVDFGVHALVESLDGLNFGWNPIESLFSPVKRKLQTRLDAAAIAKGMTPVRIPTLSYDDIDWKRTAQGLARGIKAGGVVLTFIVPPAGIAITGAMMAADKALSELPTEEAQELIDNTKALAALGDDAAKQGVAVLDTVERVRAEVGAVQGQLAVDNPGVAVPNLIANVTQGHIDSLAAAAGATSEAGIAKRAADAALAVAAAAAEAKKKAEIAKLEAKKKLAAIEYEINAAKFDAIKSSVPSVLTSARAQDAAARLFARADAEGPQFRTAAPISASSATGIALGLQTGQLKAKTAADAAAKKEAEAAAAEKKAKAAAAKAAEEAKKRATAALNAKNAVTKLPSVTATVGDSWWSRVIDWLGF